jgi:uncharacterized protein YllA (UPF0747 family)
MSEMFDKNTPYDTLKELVDFANQVDTHIVAHGKNQKIMTQQFNYLKQEVDQLITRVTAMEAVLYTIANEKKNGKQD